MNKKLPLSQDQLWLPNIDLIENSEQSFADAFFRAAQILYQQLEQIKLAIKNTEEFTKEPFNLASLSLFCKMSRHYYSYVLLEIHHDQIGSQFLTEHLCEAAITLTYLLEEVDKSHFSEYISASVNQASYLLVDVENQLHNFPNDTDLLSLTDKLKTFISKQQDDAAENLLSIDSEAHLWGPQEADTTAKRAADMGFNFMTNPARQIALRVMPASWLELQLSYLNSFANSSRIQEQPGVNFTSLRNAAHLCLHTTQTLIEEVVNGQHIKSLNVERQQQSLNALYEWFYNAHKAVYARSRRVTSLYDAIS